MNNKIQLPAEWHPQQAIQLTWPHAVSDWKYLIKEVEECFINIASAIALHQHLIIVCDNTERVKAQLPPSLFPNINFVQLTSNDTWARDHGGITILKNGQAVVYDFCFNGWGMKFAANYDNQITKKLHQLNAFKSTTYTNMNFFVLEGGSIESNGEGTLLTTKTCLLSPNRNDSLSKSEIKTCLQQFFGVKQILWLKNGYLAGDDTDSHIDTLARFCNTNTIVYIKCEDENDEHYNALLLMEKELKQFRQINGLPYNLIALPMATPVFDPEDGHRLPATYANFLITNNSILLPIYNCESDASAICAIQKAFPTREITPIDCSVLIRQHGSLHCVTMQYPQSKKS